MSLLYYICAVVWNILVYFVMRHTFKHYCRWEICFLVFVLSGFSVSAQDNISFALSGCWLFEKAEYLEQPSLGQGYQLKHTIENEEDLSMLGSCYQDVVRKACFYDEETAKIICMFTAYVGKIEFPFVDSHSVGEQSLMVFGDPETIGEASPIEGLLFNAPQIKYQMEVIDNETICIVVERSCVENGVILQGLVKCVLKRETE